jgi:phasin family protein
MENVLAAQRAALEASLEIAGKAMEGIERLAALNMQLVRETLDQQGEFAKATLGAKDPGALMNISKTLAAPAGERAASYAKEVYSIASETSAAISGSVQHQVKAAQKTMSEALDNAARTAPVGSEQLFAAARTARIPVIYTTGNFSNRVSATNRVRGYSAIEVKKPAPRAPAAPIPGKAKPWQRAAA